MLNDYELLYYCYQNNEQSFNLLMKKYERYIYYIIHIYKKTYYFFSYEDIDLYSEATILLYECVFSYRDDLEVKFSSYFLACLKKRYMVIIRSLVNNKNRGHALAMSLDTSMSNAKLDLYPLIDNKELAIAEQVYNSYLIEKGINKLKEKLTVEENKIVYYYLKGYSYDYIAKTLNLSGKKIDNTVQKYKRVLKPKDISI